MKIVTHVWYGEGPESSAIFNKLSGEGEAPGQLTPL